MTEDSSLRIAMIAAEASPFAKVGGLGDVVAALPRALEPLGVQLSILIPAYGGVHSPALKNFSVNRLDGFDVPMRSAVERAEVYQTKLDKTGVDVYLMESQKYFDRAGVYDDPATKEGYPDNMERFVFFMKSALSLLPRLHHQIDIIHCHDSHVALIPGLIRLNLSSDPFFARVGTLLTIHNLAHQGIYPRESLAYAGINARQFYPMSPFEYWGQVNFMKAGIELADNVNTVSHTYSVEIQSSSEFGMGLENVLRGKKADLSGIINGIDNEEWNPETDPLIPARFSMQDLSGKEACKVQLLRRFGLPVTSRGVPLIGMVSRLADQKGFDLIAIAIHEIAALELQLVILGTGQQHYHDLLHKIAAQYPDKLAVRFAFDNGLAHQIEAGCDMFLMPSRFEPCGLNQLYSLRYGTVPIVRATGGLADTVIPYDGINGTGFTFSAYDPAAMMIAVKRALGVYSDAKRWKDLSLNGMVQDWSWARSARQYMQLYRTIFLKKHPEG